MPNSFEQVRMIPVTELLESAWHTALATELAHLTLTLNREAWQGRLTELEVQVTHPLYGVLTLQLATNKHRQ